MAPATAIDEPLLIMSEHFYITDAPMPGTFASLGHADEPQKTYLQPLASRYFLQKDSSRLSDLSLFCWFKIKFAQMKVAHKEKPIY